MRSSRVHPRTRDRARSGPSSAKHGALARGRAGGDRGLGRGGRRPGGGRRRPARERAAFTVEAVEERERITDHDVAAFVDVVAASVGERGALDPLRADLLRRARHGARAAAAARPARSSSPGARAYRDALVDAGAGARATRSASAAPTASTPSRPPSACGWPASPSRPTATSQRLADAFEQLAFGKLSGAVGTYASVPPAVEARVMERLGLRREDVATQVVPRDRHAVLLARDRDRRRRPRALRDRGPQPAANRGARGRGAVRRRARRAPRRCPTSATRSAPSGSPASPGCCAATPRPGLENVALWHERDISHSGAERVILPDATIALDYMQHLATRVAAGMTVHTRADAREPRAHPRRALQPAGADRAGRVGDDPRRRLPGRPGERPAGLGHGHRVPRPARRGGAASSTSTRSSTTAPT